MKSRREDAMKKTAVVLSLIFTLGVAGGSLRADAAPQPGDDTVTLRDGRVLHGQVVEENKDTVVVMVDGLQRKFDRGFIKKISYGIGPVEASAAPEGQDAAASDGDTTPPPPAGTVPSQPAQGDLVDAIAVRYSVPVSDVVWVQKQGIPDSDLSMVFMVAATARVVPRVIVRLRLRGKSWEDIENHFGMNPSYIYYEPGLWGDYPYLYYDYPAIVGPWWGWGWGGGWGGGWRGGYGGHWGGGYGGGHWGGGGGHWGGGGGFRH
jgi:hypothetical protein